MSREMGYEILICSLQGKVKQIVGSTLRDLPDDGSPEAAVSLVTNFESPLSAGEFAKMYMKDGLEGGHVIMLGADQASQDAAFEALAAYPGDSMRLILLAC